MEDIMSMPEPGTQEYEDMISFMRADLESDMGLSKLIDIVEKKLKAEGKDIYEEARKWRDSK